MTVEIQKVRDAQFYLEADLEWLNRKINDERAQGFRKWVDELNFGVPKNLSVAITNYQAEMKPYFDGLIAIRDKLQAEINGVETTIAKTAITVTAEVSKYLPKEEVIEPIKEEPITKG